MAIQTVKGRLRLCWSHAGKRYFLSLFMPDTKINRAAAQLTASRIEEDIRTQNFDPTLNKYRHGEQKTQEAGALTLIDRFIKFKTSRVSAATIENHRGVRNVVAEFLNGRDEQINLKGAIAFLEWYGQRIKPTSLATRCGNLSACWDWGIEQGFVQINPWKQARKSLPKVPPPQPKPFTEDEIKQILELFKTDKRFRHYADFVEFRLLTGVRSGEAAGLRWKHLSTDLTRAQISESMVKGKRQPTKTGETREFLLSERLQNLLLRRKQAGCHPDDLVFTTVWGKPILARNFSQQYWQPALKQLGIPYRRPYNTRSTFASHALYKGLSPAEVTEITGHSQDILFKHYSGAIRQSKVPDLWQ